MAEATGRLRFVRRVGMVPLAGGDVKRVESRVLQQEWQERWGHDTGPPWWEDVPEVDDPNNDEY